MGQGWFEIGVKETIYVKKQRNHPSTRGGGPRHHLSPTYNAVQGDLTTIHSWLRVTTPMTVVHTWLQVTAMTRTIAVIQSSVRSTNNPSGSMSVVTT